MTPPALFLRRPEQWMCRGYHHVTDLNLCLSRDLKKHADASPVHCDECPLQDNLPRKPVVLTQQVESPGRPKNEHTQPSSMSVTLSFVSQEILVKVQRLPSVTDEHPLQDHPLSKPIILMLPSEPLNIIYIPIQGYINITPVQEFTKFGISILNPSHFPSSCSFLKLVNEQLLIQW